MENADIKYVLGFIVIILSSMITGLFVFIVGNKCLYDDTSEYNL